MKYMDSWKLFKNKFDKFFMGKNYYSLQPGGMQSIKELWNNQHNEHDTLESKNQVDNNLDYLSYSLLSQRHNSFFSN